MFTEAMVFLIIVNYKAYSLCRENMKFSKQFPFTIDICQSQKDLPAITAEKDVENVFRVYNRSRQRCELLS